MVATRNDWPAAYLATEDQTWPAVSIANPARSQCGIQFGEQEPAKTEKWVAHQRDRPWQDTGWHLPRKKREGSEDGLTG